MATVISAGISGSVGVSRESWNGDQKGSPPTSSTSATSAIPDPGKLDPIQSAGSGNPGRDVDNGNSPRGGGNEFSQSPWNDRAGGTHQSADPSGHDIPGTSSRDFNSPWSDNAQGDRGGRAYLGDGRSPEGSSNPSTATHTGADTSYSGVFRRHHVAAVHTSANTYGVLSWIPAGTAGTLAVGNVRSQVARAVDGFVRTTMGGNGSAALPGSPAMLGPVQNLAADLRVVPAQNPMTSSVISAKSLVPLGALSGHADVSVPVARMSSTQLSSTAQGVQRFSQPQASTTSGSGRDTGAQGLVQRSAQLVGVQGGRAGSQQTGALAGLSTRLAGSASAAVARAQVSLAQATLAQALGGHLQDKAAAQLTSGSVALRSQHGATEALNLHGEQATLAQALGGRLQDKAAAQLTSGSVALRSQRGATEALNLHGDLEKKLAARGSGRDEAAISKLQQGGAMPRELAMRLAAALKVRKRRSYDRVERVDRFTPRPKTPEMEDEEFWEEFGEGSSQRPFDDALEGAVETAAQAAVEHYRALWAWLHANDQQVLLHELKQGRRVMVLAPPDTANLRLIGHLLWPDAGDSVRVAGATGRAWMLALRWSATLPAVSVWRHWRLRQWVDAEGVWQVGVSQPDRNAPRVLLSGDGKLPVAVGECITVLDPLRLRRLMGRQWTMTVLHVPVPLDGEGVQSETW